MRVWFLKETKTIDVNCGTGANIIIGSRENTIYRITPRDNNDVNGVWLPDSHRLNFKYVADERRLKKPTVKGEAVDWRTATAIAAEILKAHTAEQLWLVASARATNEELFLTSRLIDALEIRKQHDILPRTGEADGMLIAADRNPNTTGAKLIGLCTSKPGSRLKKLAEGVRSGAIKAVSPSAKTLTKCGLTADDLKKLDAIISLDILPNQTTRTPPSSCPASAWVRKARLDDQHQRPPPAPQQSREPRPATRAMTGKFSAISSQASQRLNGLYMIEDVFKAMAADHKEFAGLSLSKIGDLGLPVVTEKAPEPAAAN